jgi:hypothetical protein
LKIATSEFLEELQRLVGKAVWAISTPDAGESVTCTPTDAVAARGYSSRNELRRLQIRTPEDEYRLRIECPWRIVRDGVVIATSYDDGRPDNVLKAAIDSLAETGIANVELCETSHDLRMTFSDGAELVLFPTSTDQTEWSDYSLKTPADRFNVFATKITREKQARIVLLEMLQELAGKPMWGMATSGSGGSRLSMPIGAMVPSDHPVDNEMLQPEMRTHDGEYSLFIVCDWRIQRGGAVVATSWDRCEPGGHMHLTAESLVGLVIAKAELREPGNVLRVTFNDSTELVVFPTAISPVDTNDWVLFTPDHTLVVLATHVRYDD